MFQNSDSGFSVPARGQRKVIDSDFKATLLRNLLLTQSLGPSFHVAITRKFRDIEDIHRHDDWFQCDTNAALAIHDAVLSSDFEDEVEAYLTRLLSTLQQAVQCLPGRASAEITINDHNPSTHTPTTHHHPTTTPQAPGPNHPN